MSIIEDYAYMGELSIRLDRFSVKSQNPYKANFRCPFCGDSKKSKRLARGWLYEKDHKMLFHCFNCGSSMGFPWFLKSYDKTLYDRYLSDTLLKSHTRAYTPVPAPTRPREYLDARRDLMKLPSIQSLDESHPAKKYLLKRKIPSSWMRELYYAERYNTWINGIVPGKLNVKYDEPRIVFPMFSRDRKSLLGVTGRSLAKNTSLRYLTIMFKDEPKIFGLDKVDFTKRYYVVEGGFDSMFLDNSVAMAGADLRLDALEHLENAVFVHDNEPRNKEIVKRMEKLLTKKLSVVIWNESIKEKDINDMVLAGVDVNNALESSIYKGLMGKMQLSQWKRVSI